MDKAKALSLFHAEATEVLATYEHEFGWDNREADALLSLEKAALRFVDRLNGEGE